MSAILFLLTGGYLLWIAAYLFHERNSRRKKAEKAGQILTRMAVDVSEILGKSTFSLSHSTPQTPEKIENEKSVSEADTFAPEKEKYPKTVSAEELDKLFAEGSPLPEELELMEDMDVPLEFRKEPADDNPRASASRTWDWRCVWRSAVKQPVRRKGFRPERRWRNFATPRCSNS